MCNCTSGNLEIPGSRFARPGMTFGLHAARSGHERLHAAYCDATKLAKQPLLRGNGVSVGISVLVRLE
jgi:hypothetical protein